MHAGLGGTPKVALHRHRFSRPGRVQLLVELQHCLLFTDPPRVTTATCFDPAPKRSADPQDCGARLRDRTLPKASFQFVHEIAERPGRRAAGVGRACVSNAIGAATRPHFRALVSLNSRRETPNHFGKRRRINP